MVMCDSLWLLTRAHRNALSFNCCSLHNIQYFGQLLYFIVGELSFVWVDEPLAEEKMLNVNCRNAGSSMILLIRSCPAGTSTSSAATDGRSKSPEPV